MSEKKKIDCKYWDNCYQKNPAHHEQYNHPFDIQSESTSSSAKTKRSPSPFLDSNDSAGKKQKLSPSIEQNLSVNSDSNESKNNSLSTTSLRKDSKSPTHKPEKSKRESKSPEKSSKSPIPGQKSNEKTHNFPENGTKYSEEEKTDENSEDSTEENSSEEMDITNEYNEVIKNLSGNNYLEIFQKRIRYSEEAEYKDLLKTPEFIRHKFLVEMPSDFYKFWDFCVSITEEENNVNKKTTCVPQAVFEKFGLSLVGPFDYLSGKFKNAKIQEPGYYLRHWRFYYDPPEFQTCFMKMKTSVHYGYWRDDPKDKDNLLIARNDSDKNCEFEFIGGNCFEMALYYLDHDCPLTPFNQKQIAKMKKSIEKYAEENDISLNTLESLKKARDKNVVCKTFHKAGLVVPFNRKTEVGYRSLIASDANIKNILSKLDNLKDNKKIIESVIEELQPIITAANIAVDECDFGTAVELGIDLFCSGFEELHDVVSSLLITGYSMLKRPQFIAIMKSHLDYRQKGNNLSVLE